MGPGAQNIDFRAKMNENGGRHHPNVNVNVHIPPGTPREGPFLIGIVPVLCVNGSRLRVHGCMCNCKLQLMLMQAAMAQR